MSKNLVQILNQGCSFLSESNFKFLFSHYQHFYFHIINPVDETKLSCYTSHRRSTTVSLETYPSKPIQAFEVGELSISQRRGVITLIPKEDSDLLDLQNWRPITLLNIDYKIASKTLAKRIEKASTSKVSAL